MRLEERLLRAAGRHRHRLGTVARVGGVPATAVVRLGAWDDEDERLYPEGLATGDAAVANDGCRPAWSPTTTSASLARS